MASPNTALAGLLDGSNFYSVPDSLVNNGQPGMQASSAGPSTANLGAQLNVPSYLQPGSILNPTNPALNTLSGAQIAAMSASGLGSTSSATGPIIAASPSAFLNFPTTANTPTYSQLAGAVPAQSSGGDVIMGSPMPAVTLTGLPGQTAGSVRAGSVMGGANNDTELGLDEVLRTLDNMKVLVTRLEELLVAQAKAQTSVFSAPADNTSTGASIMATRSEYLSLLTGLQQLAATHLVGALPVPLSSAKPAGQAEAADPDKKVSMADLTAWAEDRAGLEFSRKEAVKAGSKAILDVLRKQR